jgi:ribonuclease inhibitor
MVQAHRCILDGRTRSQSAMLARIARELDVSPARIRNLDALYDVLRTDIRGPIEIAWHGGPARGEIAPDIQAIFSVLREIARERSDVTLQLEPMRPSAPAGGAPAG